MKGIRGMRGGFCSGVWPAKRSDSAGASAAPPQPFLRLFPATCPERYQWLCTLFTRHSGSRITRLYNTAGVAAAEGTCFSHLVDHRNVRWFTAFSCLNPQNLASTDVPPPDDCLSEVAWTAATRTLASKIRSLGVSFILNTFSSEITLTTAG